MKITKRQLRRLIRESIILERWQAGTREAQSKLRYALVDYIDAYSLKTGFNPGDRRDIQRIHANIDTIVNSILGI